MRRKHCIAFTRDRALRYVYNGRDRLPKSSAVTERRQRVGGFTRLGHKQCKAAIRQNRLAISKLRSDIGLRWKPRQLFEPITPEAACIVGRSAGDHGDFRNRREIERGWWKRRSFIERIDIGVEGVCHDFRLLEYLFCHEVTMITLRSEER